MDQNISSQLANALSISDFCPDIDFIKARLIYSQLLAEAMDRHSASAFGIAWIMLIFSLFGIFSNSISFSVFSSHSMRRVPVNILLAGLSCIDLFLSIFVLPVFVTPALNLYYRLNFVDRILPYVTFILYPMTLMTQTASVWVFVVITCERWAAVVRPLQARRYSSVTNAKKAFGGVCVAAILYNLIRFGEFRLVTRRYAEKVSMPDCAIKLLFPTPRPESFSTKPPHGFVVGASTSVPEISESDALSSAPELEPRLRYDAAYMFFYYFGLYLWTHFIIPFSILLIVNVHVVWTIWRTRTLRRQLTTHERREHRIALMMGVVVVTFLFCNTIPFAMNLLEAYDRDYFRRVETLYITHLVNDIGNLLVVVGSSTTCLIYYAFSQRYRRYCATRLCCSKCTKNSRFNRRSYSLKDSLHAETMLVDHVTDTPVFAGRDLSPRRCVHDGTLVRNSSHSENSPDPTFASCGYC